MREYLVLATDEGNKAGDLVLVFLPLRVVLVLLVSAFLQHGNTRNEADQAVLKQRAQSSKTYSPSRVESAGVGDSSSSEHELTGPKTDLSEVVGVSRPAPDTGANEGLVVLFSFPVLPPLRLLTVSGHFETHASNPDRETEVVTRTKRRLRCFGDRVDKVNGKSSDGDPSSLHHPGAEELGWALLDLVESAVTTGLLDTLEKEAAETHSPEERETSHDGLTRVEGRQRSRKRDVLEAVKGASTNPWHIQRQTSGRDEAKRATKIVVLFRLERNCDGGAGGLETIDNAEGRQKGLEADGICAHCCDDQKCGTDADGVRAGRDANSTLAIYTGSVFVKKGCARIAELARRRG